MNAKERSCKRKNTHVNVKNSFLRRVWGSLAQNHLPAVISFLSEVTIVMISIYLPYRASQLGADSLLVGLVGASGSAVYMFAPFFTGRLSDRIGPKRLLAAGASVVAGLCFVYTLVGDPMVFVALRVLEGIAWAMIWPPLEALYSVSGSDTYKSMKTFNMAWGLGAIAAPLLGSFIVDRVSVSGTLLASAVAMLLALVASLRLKGRRPLHTVAVRQQKSRLDPVATIVMLSFAMVYGVTMATFSTFFPKFATSLNLSATLWGTVLSVLLAGRLLAFIVSERVRFILGMRKTQTIFLLVATLFPVYSVLPNPDPYLLALSSLVTGLGLGLVYSATLSGMLTGPAEGRGRSAGLFESSLGFGSFIGPALAGVVASAGLWLTMVLPLVPMLGALVAGWSRRQRVSGPFVEVAT